MVSRNSELLHEPRNGCGPSFSLSMSRWPRQTSYLGSPLQLICCLNMMHKCKKVLEQGFRKRIQNVQCAFKYSNNLNSKNGTNYSLTLLYVWCSYKTKDHLRPVKPLRICPISDKYDSEQWLIVTLANTILLINDQKYLPLACWAWDGLGKVWDELKTPMTRWPPERQEKQVF